MSGNPVEMIKLTIPETENNDNDENMNGLMMQGDLEKLINLIAKSAYEITKVGMVTEHLFFKSGGNEKQLNLYKDTAAEYVRRRLAEENVQTQAFLLEENDKLKQQIEELEETIKQYEEQIAQYAKREQQYKKALQQAKTNIEEVVKQYRYLAQWTVRLMDELRNKYSRFRNNDVLIQEYIEQHPLPQGIK